MLQGGNKLSSGNTLGGDLREWDRWSGTGFLREMCKFWAIESQVLDACIGGIASGPDFHLAIVILNLEEYQFLPPSPAPLTVLSLAALLIHGHKSLYNT